MVYSQLYRKFAPGKTISAGLIGSGHYGTAVLTQAQRMELLRVPVVADRNREAAVAACRHAGLEDEQIVLCDTREQALRALNRNCTAVLEDPMLMMDLPLDVIAEATGMPEAGARHALEAIRHGKHVAMISKEPDSVVGPMLKRIAERAGLVYTAVDGDQHGLLMGWVGWIRGLGLEIVCAGKVRDVEFVCDPAGGRVACTWDRTTFHEEAVIPPEDRRFLEAIPAGRAAEYFAARARLFERFPQPAPFDLCETVVAANATGLVPDLPRLHHPIVRTIEIPEVLAAVGEGGILQGPSGTIDLVTCLRGNDEAGLGGGVFAVISCANAYSRNILMTKGLIPNRRQSTALLYRPHHLCGVETSVSLLCAGLLGLPTGADTYLPHWDLNVRVLRDRKAGETLDCERDSGLEAHIVPAVALSGRGPLPAHLGTGRRFKRDVPAGTTLSEDMVEIASDSVLLALRREQDACFGTGAADASSGA